MGDVLQHHRLAGFRRRDDQAALAAPTGAIMSMTRLVMFSSPP
jgi:hypothetical protein